MKSNKIISIISAIALSGSAITTFASYLCTAPQSGSSCAHIAGQFVSSVKFKPSKHSYVNSPVSEGGVF